MTIYLEQDKLIPGTIYRCETYLGHDVVLKYVGKGLFIFHENNPCKTLYKNVLRLEGDVRYVFGKKY